jgi:hypothetical protein
MSCPDQTHVPENVVSSLTPDAWQTWTLLAGYVAVLWEVCWLFANLKNLTPNAKKVCTVDYGVITSLLQGALLKRKRWLVSSVELTVV